MAGSLYSTVTPIVTLKNLQDFQIVKHFIDITVILEFIDQDVILHHYQFKHAQN